MRTSRRIPEKSIQTELDALLEARLFEEFSERKRWRSGVILLVGMPSSLMSELQAALRESGRSVLACYDSEQAVDLLEDHPNYFREIILDSENMEAEQIREFLAALRNGKWTNHVFVMRDFSHRFDDEADDLSGDSFGIFRVHRSKTAVISALGFGGEKPGPTKVKAESRIFNNDVQPVLHIDG